MLNPAEITILITDDDPTIRYSFADYLSDQNYNILTAENGRVGLDIFKKEKPDLVLLDLRMPEMDGIELLKEINKITDEIPLIVISGTGKISDAIDALLEGAWDYLLKPVADLNVLQHTVTKALEHARLKKENRRYHEKLEQLVQERTKELARANTQLTAINDRLNRVVKTIGGLSLCHSVKQFGKEILTAFAKHMHASGGSIYIVEETQLVLLHVLDEGHAPKYIPLPLPERSIMKKAIDLKQPLLLENMNAPKEVEGSGWAGYKDNSGLVFPIENELGEIDAVLTLHNKLEPPFIPQDKEIGTILASYSCESLRATKNHEALSESEQRFRELAELLPQSIIESDTTGTIVYANQMAIESFGYSLDEFLSGMVLNDLLMVRSEQKLEEKVDGHEFIAITHAKKQFSVLVYSDPITRDDIITGVRSVIVDISLIKRQEEKILQQAHYDELTKLPNRFLVLDRLSQSVIDAQRNKQKVAILFIDLDDFKKVNDTMGHEAGDEVLVQAADRFNKIIRQQDTIGRLGGDEFIVILGGLDDITAIQSVAKNILDQFRAVFTAGKREFILTASIGVSVYPDDAQDASSLLRNADSAMYFAKEQGRNTYSFFTAEMNKQVSRRIALEEQIHHALEREEFEVYYQPKINISTNQIMGAEALLRWHNPVLGSVSPDEFIPIAEHTGLIMPIGDFVLRQALKQTKLWQHKQAEFYIAVNLSPRQFRDPDLISTIRNHLTQSGVSAHYLELEITEGVLLDGNPHINKALLTLNKMGIKISMDDFGTGYSSLSYLRSYPFNILKIDRSFISGLTEDQRDYELINATIAMAHGLNLQVVAEGVETQEQLSCLKKLHCDYAQGYLFSKPICASEFVKLLPE